VRGAELVPLNETWSGNTFPALSFPNYRDMRDRNTVLSGLAAYRFLPASLGARGNSQRLWGYLVTGNYFDLLGVQATIGRVFRPEDDVKPGGHPLAVLSYACWQKRFGGDPGVAGRQVKFNGMDFTVLGVAPRGFFGTELYYVPDVFFPMMMQKEREGGGGYLESRQSWRIRGAFIGFAAALFAVSRLVLLVACTNLASMLLARAADRRKEIALRLAIGGAGGALLAAWITDALAGWRPPTEFPLVISAAPDTRVFLFALLVSVATTVLFGLGPQCRPPRQTWCGR